MITRSKDFDLGRDKERMKDPNDAARQHRTVDALLERFFHPRSGERFEIQILADEVGMGKTFVALGLAYSILANLKQARVEPDLDGCYQRILVLTPSNHALFRKWYREVSEFKRRCVSPEHRSTDLNFEPLAVDRLDDLAIALRKPGRQPQIIVARMGLFGGDRLMNLDLKRQFTLGVLFRYWGVSFNYEQRQRLLKGAPENWPNQPDHLTELSQEDDELLPFTEEQFIGILRKFDADGRQELDSLLAECREIAEPFRRDRDELFNKIERRLRDVYRRATLRSIQGDFPLLIVDEAHNWKNGPNAGANGYEDFSKFIAPHVRRALLLTATPFQLRPDEMLEILKVSDDMQPCPTQADSMIRTDRLKKYREKTIRPVLANAENHSRHFSRAWIRIPHRVAPDALAAAWISAELIAARKKVVDLTGCYSTLQASAEGIAPIRCGSGDTFLEVSLVK